MTYEAASHATSSDHADETPRRRILFHIGPPKTGTTYLQRLLWWNVDTLEQAGVFLPGSGQADHFNIGRSIRNEPRRDARVDKEWVRSLDQAMELFEASGCHTAIITDERLPKATRRQVERSVDRLGGHEVEILYCMRDLSGLLASQWQERVKNGVDAPFEDWLESVRKHRPMDPFWRFHDIEQVLARWSPDWSRPVHVLILPPPSAGPTELWRRLQRVVGWDVVTDTQVPAANTSLGLLEADLLRRVQERMADDVPDPYRTAVLKGIIANNVLSRRSADTPILIPVDNKQWIDEENERRVEFLRSSPVHLVGDVAEITNDERRFGSMTVAGQQDEQLEAAVDVIVELARRLAATEASLDAAGKRRRKKRRKGKAGKKSSAKSAVEDSSADFTVADPAAAADSEGLADDGTAANSNATADGEGLANVATGADPAAAADNEGLADDGTAANSNATADGVNLANVATGADPAAAADNEGLADDGTAANSNATADDQPAAPAD